MSPISNVLLFIHVHMYICNMFIIYVYIINNIIRDSHWQFLLSWIYIFDSTIKLPNWSKSMILAEPPQPTKKCPRRNGFFAHPDPSVCNVFYNCIDGEAIEITCTTGLHFDEYSGTCVWPDSAGREVKSHERDSLFRLSVGPTRIASV